jgi:cold shock CspA family protein
MVKTCSITSARSRTQQSCAADARRYIVHHSEIQSGGEYATLNDGQKVEYEVGQGQKGPCANKVVPI